ncbi:unnamed protein product [Prorocentrum cordatum]|uniref:Uncharacterized protein n=1 Tax=Prorocentrum cordatum TaxID=2364126 RepID=A0ABN9VFE1_9DINO|nr:unnamed protein product [Polarella glacialis]
MVSSRSAILNAAAVLACASPMAAFVPWPVESRAPVQSWPTAAPSAAVLAKPTAVLAEGSSVWLPALSAVGAGFAVGLATIGSRVGRGIASSRRVDGISRPVLVWAGAAGFMRASHPGLAWHAAVRLNKLQVADDPRGVLLLSLAFVESLAIYGLVIAMVVFRDGLATFGRGALERRGPEWARRAFARLPEGDQRSHAETSLGELAAYVRWRAVVWDGLLPEAAPRSPGGSPLLKWAGEPKGWHGLDEQLGSSPSLLAPSSDQ